MEQRRILPGNREGRNPESSLGENQKVEKYYSLSGNFTNPITLQNVRENRITSSAKSGNSQGATIHGGSRPAEIGKNAGTDRSKESDTGTGLSSNEGTGRKIDPQFERTRPEKD